MSTHVDNNPNPTASSSTLPLPLPARSLFSKLTSPLKKSRTRNLSDFHIRPLEPHRQYSPGDLVKGAVVLTVTKPIRITHLTVCLHGFVRVYKYSNAANEPVPLSDGGLTASNGRRKSQYYGNGHASLFQDETTLCGEGRLEAGIYEFNFELEFPSEGLPTSIDFERGAISYMITSTITRPTSIAATSSCDTKLSLVETVDVGPLAQPKPRVISLEPISRRTRKKTTTKAREDGPQEVREGGSSSDATPNTRSPIPEELASASGRESLEVHPAPQSPTPSDVQSSVSAESTASTGTGLSFRRGSAPSTSKSPRSSQGTSERASTKEKTITTTIELLKSGCLPGENLTVKLSVQHSKAIKSLHGVIVTFYRQGRIDFAPPLSLFADLNGKAAEKLKHDEYYPKSKTGLGGLSLTSAGSSSVFRKDLSQTFAPLIVDPTTLTAVVSASVRVPEDVFPTISGVPGAMISFEYYVEVVVDLGGRLAGQQRHLPRIGTMPVSTSYGSSRSDGQSNMLSAWGGSTVDTDHIRREKSVVACAFDVTIGTVDSERKRHKFSEVVAEHGQANDVNITGSDQTYAGFLEDEQPRDGPDYHQQDERHTSGHYQGYYHNEIHEHQEIYEEHLGYYQPPLHTLIPPPEVDVEEEEVGEKERARRAEERLLPSQPPIATPVEGSSSFQTTLPPSAPFLPHEDEREELYGVEAAAPRISPTELAHEHQVPQNAPSAPTRADHEPSVSASNSSNTYPPEDKQELERRRLLAEASAPSEEPEPEEGGSSEAAAQLQPSAPVLSDEDEYGSGYAHLEEDGSSRTRESLPRYER